MGNPNKACKTESNEDYGDPTPEISEGRNISDWAGSHSCDVWTKDLTTFCFYPKNLAEAKFKSDRLISLVKKTSELH